MADDRPSRAEVYAEVNADPSRAQALADAEAKRRKPRVSLVEALEAIASRQPAKKPVKSTAAKVQSDASDGDKTTEDK